ncbi:MAG TPA: enoyl-CoA hydratase/isomerase family protein [Pedococcus sp.]
MSDTQRPHPHLRVTRDGPVLTVTLDNLVRRNAQTPSLWLALADIAASLDPQVRVVVLRAEGPAFSAGIDLAMLSPGGVDGEVSMLAPAAVGPEEMAATIAPYQRGFTAWAEVDAVVVAAVQGHAIGAGFQLALAADLRVVADDVQLAMRETSLGLVPDLGGTWPLVRAVGYGKALEICVSGRAVGAAEAVACGLASVAVPVDELVATTDDLVAAVLAAPEAAARELKPLLRQAQVSGREDQLRHEREAQGRLLHELVTRAAAAEAGETDGG